MEEIISLCLCLLLYAVFFFFGGKGGEVSLGCFAFYGYGGRCFTRSCMGRAAIDNHTVLPDGGDYDPLREFDGEVIRRHTIPF